jgi:hypothetical protein
MVDGEDAARVGTRSDRRRAWARSGRRRVGAKSSGARGLGPVARGCRSGRRVGEGSTGRRRSGHSTSVNGGRGCAGECGRKLFGVFFLACSCLGYFQWIRPYRIGHV